MAWIPQGALGAVLLMAGWGLIDIKSLGSIRRLSRFEFWLCLLTTVGVLGLGVLPGIVFAVTLAILRLLYSIYQHRCRTGLAAWDRRPGRHPQIQGRAHRARLVVYRFDDAILFFNADYFKMRLLEAVQSQDQPKAVLFDAEAVTNIDVSGIAALREVRDTLAAQGIFFAIARAGVRSCACWCARGWRGKWKTSCCSDRYGPGFARTGCGATGTAVCRLPSRTKEVFYDHWPYRRQASSHRYDARLMGCAVPVGAGLPATGPVQPTQDPGVDTNPRTPCMTC